MQFIPYNLYLFIYTQDGELFRIQMDAQYQT